MRPTTDSVSWDPRALQAEFKDRTHLMGLRRLSKKKEILLSMVTHMEVGAVFSRNITDTRAGKQAGTGL